MTVLAPLPLHSLKVVSAHHTSATRLGGHVNRLALSLSAFSRNTHIFFNNTVQNFVFTEVPTSLHVEK